MRHRRIKGHIKSVWPAFAQWTYLWASQLRCTRQLCAKLCARALQHLGPISAFSQELQSLLGHCEVLCTIISEWQPAGEMQDITSFINFWKHHLLLNSPDTISTLDWEDLEHLHLLLKGKTRKERPLLPVRRVSLHLCIPAGTSDPGGSDGACSGERFAAGSAHRGHFSWTKHISFQRAKTQAGKKPSVCSAFNPDPHMLQELEMQLIMSGPFTLLEKLFIITIVSAWHWSPQ